MTLNVNSSSLSSDGKTLTISGTSTQTVAGVPLAAQVFNVKVDVSDRTKYPYGTDNYVLQNSNGDSVAVPFAEAAPLVESLDGTIINSTAGQLVDANGIPWTLVNGGGSLGLVVYQNGQPPALGYTQNVTEIVYHNHKVYQTNGSGWWYWDNVTPWVATTSPLAPVESGELATVTNTTGKLIDASGNVWTLHDDSANGNGNVVYENGVKPALGISLNVIKLVYHNHKVYQVNVNEQAWYWDGATPWVGPVADPTAPTGTVYPGPVQPTFFGVNGHFDWGGNGVDRQAVQPTAADYHVVVNAMKDLGLKTYRNGFGDWGGEGAVWADFINNYATPAGIAVYPNIEGNYDPTQDGHTSTEASAYTVGYNIGKDCATALKGLVPYYEIGNEDDAYAINGSGVDGTQVSHYDNRRFTIVRGYYRGVIDGIKSVDTTTPIMNGGITWLHVAYLDMLWNGTQPDGTTGHPTVRWDITSAHWYTNNYSGNDNPESAAGVNWLQKLASYGKPIRITEFGANYVAYNSESAVSAAITGPYLMAGFYNLRAKYNIIGCDYYQIIDAAGDTSTPLTGNEMEFGTMNYDGTHKARYAAIKTLVAASPA